MKHIPRWKKAEFEEIEYETKSIKEILKEMKNICELIVDLAYSAILFDNREIADEVRYLEVKMDKLNYQIRIMAMMASRTKEDAEKMAGILQIAEAAESIANAAGDMVKILSYRLTHPILPTLVKESSEMIRVIKVGENSSAKGKSIKDLKISSETGVRIIAIRRGNSWIYGPKGEEKLCEGDMLICIGPDEGLKNLSKLLKGEIEVL
ncbi:MAG: potassium transporter TrkA [Thermoplasmatales archaeon]|nr:potassium transporter TrkA [Thermoplasmatales archaeon]